VPVDRFLGGISHFQKHVDPKHQALFEKLAFGQRPAALFAALPRRRRWRFRAIEYALGVLQVPKVIVCGHTDCR
jgi:carbonic anhydrase